MKKYMREIKMHKYTLICYNTMLLLLFKIIHKLFQNNLNVIFKENMSLV